MTEFELVKSMYVPCKDWMKFVRHFSYRVRASGVAGLLAAGRADEAAGHRGSVGAAGALRPPPRLRLQREDLQGEAAAPLPLLRRRRRRPRGTCVHGRATTDEHS